MNAVVEMVNAQPIAAVLISNTSLKDAEHCAIARTLMGDRNAFNELVTQYESFAYSLAFRILQSREAASDAVQDSFLKAFRALASFHSGSFKGWLARIIVNICYDAIRRERRIGWEEITDEHPYDHDANNGPTPYFRLTDKSESPQDFVERMELNIYIELGLRSLPYEQRLILVLSDIYGYHYDEISEITEIPMGTVKSRLSRARLKLRDFLLKKPELLSSEFTLSKSRN